jgi:hypothetical protein
MKIPFKIENRLLVLVTAVITITGTVLIMNIAVIKPMRKMYEVQSKKQSDLIVELAKISKYSIQNTYTIRKPKKGSTVILEPTNDLTVQEVTRGLDEKILNIMSTDTIKENKPLRSWFKRVFSSD